MKAVKEQIIHAHHQSFSVTEFEQDYFDSPWHFHVEYELTYVKYGYGTRFVGTSSELFNKGDLVLVGSLVPHYWRCGNAFYDKKELKAKSMVVQFHGDLFFKNELPETKNIRLLLKKSASGICFENGFDYEEDIKVMFETSGINRLLLFYQLLEKLSKSKNKRLLSTSEESQLYQAKDSVTFQKILNHIFQNIQKDISIASVAHEVHMSRSAFCKYFKKRTKKTFTQYVNNLRVDNAAKLLVESDLNVSQICFESGFNSLSYFNRQFKKYKGTSPKIYIKLYRNLG